MFRHRCGVWHVSAYWMNNKNLVVGWCGLFKQHLASCTQHRRNGWRGSSGGTRWTSAVWAGKAQQEPMEEVNPCQRALAEARPGVQSQEGRMVTDSLEREVDLSVFLNRKSFPKARKKWICCPLKYPGIAEDCCESGSGGGWERPHLWVLEGSVVCHQRKRSSRSKNPTQNQAQINVGLLLPTAGSGQPFGHFPGSVSVKA